MLRNTESPKYRPVVGLLVDCTDTYGRSLFRGVMRYANLQRRWLVFKDYRRVTGVDIQWPKLDGAIIGGAPYSLVGETLGITPHVIHCSGGSDGSVCPVVSLDDLKVGQLAAEHLMECGLEHFAFYGIDPKYLVAENRLTGFRNRLAEKKKKCIECPIPRPEMKELISRSNRSVLIQWLEGLPKPVGIMCFDDSVASDLAEACLECKMRVPEDIAIIGVNNDDLLCESAWPPISSVETDYIRVGFAAAKLLDRMLNNQNVEESERCTRLAPIRVVQRQSTNILTIKDRNIADAVRYIRDHACDPCSVSDILKVVPVGRRWLEREFVLQLGRTLHDEITNSRMKTACRLIVESDLNIDEIATRCGYASIKSFYSAFGKTMGVTPAGYRRKTAADKSIGLRDADIS